METITGIINKIVYSKPDNDFKVFAIKRRDRSIIRVTGDFPHVIIGAKIQVHGNFKTHHKYGVAFNAESYTFDCEKSVAGITLYLRSIAKWVGPDRSMKIAEKFKDNIEEVITKTPERLMEIEGIGKKVAESISEAWLLNKEMRNIKIFLHSLGFGRRKMNKIIAALGHDTEEKLKENPWVLINYGFGFSTCDYIAYRLERDMKNVERYRWLIVYILRQTLSAGHLFLYPQQLLNAFNKYNRQTPYPFKENDFTLEEIAPYVKHMVTERFIINDRNRIYDLDSFYYETETATLLSRIKNTPSDIKCFEEEDVEAYIQRYEKEHSIKDFKLKAKQKEAIRSFFKEKVMIMTGFPGSGKTETVRSFVQYMKEKGIEFELITPTGISAKKLGYTANHSAYTIHRRFGYRGSDGWEYNKNTKYQTDVVIVDETSMVDMELLYRLISALYSKTKVIFVGDNDQLPSVGPGCCLRDMINCGEIKTIFLNEIVRQDNASDIVKASKKIRDGDSDLSLFKSDSASDIWHIEDYNEDRIENTLKKFCIQLKERAKTKKNVTFQIITPRNQGPLSVFTLNNLLQEVLNPRNPEKAEVTLGEYTIRKGDRIIIRKNNYDLGVFNGDVGKAVFITSGSITVDIEDSEESSRRIEIPLGIAEDMVKLAYCLTIHKAQGLEYTLVIIPFIEAHGTLLLQRNLLYTALTRAKKKVIMIGQSSAIEYAIQNDKIQKRNTLLSERIKEWMNGTGISLRTMCSDSENCQNAQYLEQLLYS
jgi:exodeoxyribonuclease V alpha subunit